MNVFVHSRCYIFMNGGGSFSGKKNLPGTLQPFGLVVVFWWWVVVPSWCVGGGHVMCCDVMWYDVMLATWHEVMWLFARWCEVR